MENGFLKDFYWRTENSLSLSLSLSGLFHVKPLSDSTAGVEQQKTIDSPDSHLLLFGKSGFYEGLRVFFHRKAC